MALNNLGLGFVFTAKDLASGTVNRLRNDFADLKDTASEGTKTLNRSFKDFGKGLAVFGAGVAGLAALDRATQVSREFGAALAEVTTLVDKAALPTAELESITADLALQFGGTATEQARALYQAISAGASDSQSATAVLSTANQLAIGGVTELSIAVGALSAATNTYSATGLTALEASDALFVAMRGGITTVGELAGSIGRVIPTAEGLNVGLDETLAAISAITTKGINTSEAVTGLKAALANVIKPTKDATDEAKRLGIQFDAASLRSKGLAGFLSEITGSAKFSEDSLSKLFGSVEGLNAVMALASDQSSKFNELLGQMASKSGQTGLAVAKMSDTLAFVERRFEATRSEALRAIGTAIEPLRKAVVKIADAVLRAFLAIPKPVGAFLVQLVAIASAVTAVVGAVIAAKAGFGILIAVLGTAGVVALGPLLVLIAKITLVIGGLIVASKLVAAAFKRDLGGIATFFRGVFDKVKLVVHAMRQLFSRGGFSGDVRDELNRAENSGIKRFAIAVFRIVFRLQRLFGGIAEGFGAAVAGAAPAFAAFVDALRVLMRTFASATSVGSDFAAGAAETPSELFRQLGVVIGMVAGSVIPVMVGGLNIMIRTFAFLVGIVRAVIGLFEIAGTVLGGLVEATVALIAGDFAGAWLGLKDVVYDVVKTILGLLETLVGAAAGVVDAVGSIFGVDLGADEAIRKIRRDIEGGLGAALGVELTSASSADASVAPMARGQMPLTGAGPMPAVAAARGARASASEDIASLARGIERLNQRPVVSQVSLNVDGEEMANVTHRAEQNGAARSFGPTPAFGAT